MEDEDKQISQGTRTICIEDCTELENCDLIPNSQPIQCPICIQNCEARESVVLRNCSHTFCRSCLANAIRRCPESVTNCPYKDCESTLCSREIGALSKIVKNEEYAEEETSMQELEALMWFENCAVILNTKSIECPLCFLTYAPLEGIILRDCLHAFCRPCIVKTIRYCEGAEVKCPFWDGEFTCESTLQHREIRALVDPEIYEQYLEKSVAQAVNNSENNTFRCKTPDCRGWCIYEDNVNNFLCPICKVDNCLTDQIIKDDEQWISEEVKRQRYEARITLENCGIKLNSETIECPICFVSYGPQQGVVLWDCLHTFCRPCIAEAIRHCEDVEIQCPYGNNEYACKSTLQEREIKALVEPEIYQKHLAKSIVQAESRAGLNAFHCKTPDCLGWCIRDDDNITEFQCPVCFILNCIACQVIHTGKSCQEYQDELQWSKESDDVKRSVAMLEEMVRRGDAIKCPTCGVPVEKRHGCDSLICSMCKTYLCWATKGPRWGPGGVGDISGGCRCGVNNIRCHPSCSNCH